MLQKKYRLKKHSAFTATYKLRNIASDDFFCVYLGKHKDIQDLPTKFAFVVSKKVHKRAVVRNRIKRLMRESVRLQLKNNELKDMQDYLSVICVAKSNAINTDFSTVDNSIKTLFSKLIKQ